MKYLLLTLLLLASPAYADDSLVQGSISGAVRMLGQADAEGAGLGQAKLAIQNDASQWQTAKNQFEATNAALTKESADFEQAAAHNRSWGDAVLPEVNRYNAQCSGTGDQAYVNQCNTWKANLAPIHDRYNADVERVQTWKANLQSRLAANTQTHDQLASQWDRLKARVAENERQGQAYLAKRAQIVREIEELENNFNSQCRAAANAGNRERAKEVCGTLFDGNTVHSIHIPDLPSAQWSSWGASTN